MDLRGPNSLTLMKFIDPLEVSFQKYTYSLKLVFQPFNVQPTLKLVCFAKHHSEFKKHDSMTDNLTGLSFPYTRVGLVRLSCSILHKR